MARYMERAENLARILDVNETFARDSRGAQDWLPMVQLNADESRFFSVHGEANASTVTHFYVLDRTNPTSIVSAVHMARENARSLRHLISTEMWRHLNVFYELLGDVAREDLALSELSRLCATIKENCQTHTGITEGTFHRDEVWHFYQLGKTVERADQTTRLLDIKYHRLLPSSEDVGSPVDLSQWNSLLRSAAGYHAFRRVHPRGMRPANVAGFLLFNTEFPRLGQGLRSSPPRPPGRARGALQAARRSGRDRRPGQAPRGSRGTRHRRGAARRPARVSRLEPAPARRVHRRNGPHLLRRQRVSPSRGGGDWVRRRHWRTVVRPNDREMGRKRIR